MFWSATGQGVRLSVKVTPRARHSGIIGPAPEADGSSVLRVAVTEPPEGGKANAALLKLLAKQCGVAKSHLEIVAGSADRRKTILVRGDFEALRARLLDVYG